jgi:hypothetical protein
VQELKFVGVQDNALILTGEDGMQARLVITDALRSAIRAAHTPEQPAHHTPRPRDIQALLRAGQSAQQVADHFGVDVGFIEKFQVPVVAELQHMVDLAQRVPLGYSEDDAEVTTFGDIILHRLVTRQATNTVWRSWREQDGRWTVQVSFDATGGHHDARWFFDARRQQLEPANDDASTLSTAQDLTPIEDVPRLRVVDAATTPEKYARQTGEPLPTPEPSDAGPARPALRAAPPTQVGPITVQRLTAVDDEPEPRTTNNTEDLLEALRKHRGERPARPAVPPVPPVPESTIRPARHAETAAEPAAPADAPRNQDEPLDLFASTDTGEVAVVESAPVPAPESTAHRGRGRASMPSWDEIVFGTKPHGQEGDDAPSR